MDALELRYLTPDDHAAGVRFYESQGYAGGIAAGDRTLAAIVGTRIVGLVRLAEEEGVLLLRGMFIDASAQRRGIGRRMLARLAQRIGDTTCWLTCPPHLSEFYGLIGFQPVAYAEAPPHLAARSKGYEAEHGAQGIMRRPANAP